MDEYSEFPEESFSSVWNNCVIPSLWGIYPKFRDILVSNIMFNLITQSFLFPPVWFHTVSVIEGVYVLYLMIDENIIHFISFLIFAYMLLNICYGRISSRVYGFLTIATCVSYLLFSEYYHSNHHDWLKVRGIFMIATMKIISLSYDVQYDIYFPSFIEYLGYACSPANSIFGPWMPYREYVRIRECPIKKNYKWVLRIVTSTFLALFFLIFSNCLGSYLIPEDSFKWLVAYRQAQSFRSSHYFISYMSEAMVVAAGYCDNKYRFVKRSWGFRITKPLDIEFPMSLVSVVVSWNIPMHKFLKRYVYRPLLSFGRFGAIILTFFVSSLLHGFNTELTAVLLSIGIGSYVQMKFQEKLATQLDACLGVRICRNCQHNYKRGSTFVKGFFLLFSVFSIINLIYLGSIMDSVGFEMAKSIYEKWEHLDFLGHGLIFNLFVYTILT